MVRLPQLDGLRALAVLGVLVCHTSDSSWAYLGPFGVRLFFVISGFLITRILLDQRGAPTGLVLRAFYWRRFVRIVPLYYVALVVYCGVGVPGARELWPWLVTYTSNLVDPATPLGFVGHFWSLAVEEQFYLIWPPLILLLGRRAVPIVLYGAVLLGPMWRFMMPVDEPMWQGWMPACLDALGLGAVLAYRGVRTSTGRDGWYTLFILVPVTVALAMYGESWGVSASWRLALEPFLEAVIAMLLVERAATGRFSRVLETAPLVYVGTLSYGVYVWHGVACAMLPMPRGPERFYAVAALSILLAAGSWHLFERWCNEQRHRFPYRRHSQVT